MPGNLKHLSLLLALLAAACSQFIQEPSETVGPGYTRGGGEWESGGGITIAARAFERGGVTVVCGAWTTGWQSGISINLNENIIEAASVYVGETRVVQNLMFMAWTPYAGDLSGAQANCIALGRSWPAEHADRGTSIIIPQQQFILDDEGGLRATFRQTGRPEKFR
jgi:hypothetical protein